jgi:hypothetical protein
MTLSGAEHTSGASKRVCEPRREIIAQPSELLQILLHEAVHDARFLERLTPRDISAL